MDELQRLQRFLYDSSLERVFHERVFPDLPEERCAQLTEVLASLLNLKCPADVQKLSTTATRPVRAPSPTLTFFVNCNSPDTQDRVRLMAIMAYAWFSLDSPGDGKPELQVVDTVHSRTGSRCPAALSCPCGAGNGCGGRPVASDADATRDRARATGVRRLCCCSESRVRDPDREWAWERPWTGPRTAWVLCVAGPAHSVLRQLEGAWVLCLAGPAHSVLRQLEGGPGQHLLGTYLNQHL